MRAPSSWPNHLSKAYLLIPPPCGTFQHMNEGGEKYTKDHSTFQIFAWHVQRDMFKIRRIFLHIFYIFSTYFFYIFSTYFSPRPDLPNCLRRQCDAEEMPNAILGRGGAMHESEKWKWSRSVMSDPSRPHGLQPTRLLCPRDFPGKSTGVGCHCLLRYTIGVSVNLTPRFEPKYKRFHY